ncbi:Laminin subunit alpha-2 [Luteimonas sp. MJ174]|uniref:Laminin subunit alpha-2 n=1 Tax=Luteimonas sp. MJ174 TaxID=3129237 RepID=UPI0031BAADF9
MAGNTYEEVLRFLIEAKGDENVARLAKQILSLGDAGEEAQTQTAAMLDEFGKAKGLSRTADDFRTLGTRVVELTQRYGDLRTRTEAVATEIAAAEKPTARQEREFAKLTRQLGETGRELSDARGQWSTLRGVLEDSGVATQRYSDLQEQVAQKQRAAADAIRDYAAQQLEVRDAARDTANRLEEQDEAFRKQVAAGRQAKEALEAYRERAAAAADETKNLAGAAQASTGILSAVKTAAAGVFGFFSVRGIVDGIKAIVTEGSNAEDELAQLQAVLQSTGREAEFTGGELQKLADDLAEVSRFSAGEIVNAETRLLSYTNILRDEFPDAMQIVVDQSARLGISLEQSAEIVGRALQTPTKAMEALGRQGFVLEDSQKALLKQLEATGREAEAQQIIMDLLVESYGGAAAAQKLNNARGLWQSLTERIRDFQTQVAEAGVLDYFKRQMADLLESGKRLAADGTLARWAKQTSDAIVAVAEAVRGGTRFLVDHAGALAFMGRAYAALKLAQWAVALNGWRVALVASTQAALLNAGALDRNAGAATRLGRAVRAIPTSIKIAVALVGIDLAIKGSRALGEALAKNSDAAKHAAEISGRVREQLRLEAQARAEVMAGLAEYSKTAVLTADQVASLSDTEREAYEKRLAGLQDYLRAQLGYLLRQKEIGLATQEQLAQLAELPARLAAVRAGYVAIGDGVRLAATAMEQVLSPAAQRIIEKLGQIDRDGKLAASSIRDLFDGLNFVEGNALGDVGLALAQIAVQSAGADRNVRDGLQATLRQLSGQDLLRFQSAALAAFAEFKRGPAETAAVLDSTLLAAMERLGISAERMGLRFTDVGRDATAAFSTILENANATSQQIETAFSAALSKVATLEEAKALGALLKQAGLDGKIGFDEAERAGAALENRIRGITNAMDPLNDQFAQLGIRSKAELDAAADAARSAFEAIREGASRGEAAVEDVRAAFQKYSEAARAAVANSDIYAQAEVEAKLRVLDSIHNVNAGLDEMGRKGREAGSGIVEGASGAASALTEVAGAAEQAAAAQDKVAKSASTAGSNASLAGSKTGEFKAQLSGLTDQLVKAYFAANRYVSSIDTGIWSETVNRITAAHRQQAEALARVNAEMDEQLAKQDPLAKQMERLKDQYPYLEEAQLRASAEKSKRLEDERQRAADEAKRLRDEARREREAALANSGATAAPVSGPVQSAAIVERRVAMDLRTDEGDFTLEVPRDQEELAYSVFAALNQAKRMSTRAIGRGNRR